MTNMIHFISIAEHMVHTLNFSMKEIHFFIQMLTAFLEKSRRGACEISFKSPDGVSVKFNLKVLTGCL